MFRWFFSWIWMGRASQDQTNGTPGIQNEVVDGTMNAGRDLASNNVVQQGWFNWGIGNLQFHWHVPLFGTQDRTYPSSYIKHQADLGQIKDKIGAHIVAEAQLSQEVHGEVPVCHEETRVALLESILAWVEADSANPSTRADVSSCAWCIVGAPGSGKSTIINTLITRLLEEALRQCPGLITAHYSIRRTIPSTTDINKILTTLILQLAIASPHVAGFTTRFLETLPHTGILSLNVQQRLFSAGVWAYKKKVFVIIDALDESSRPDSLAASLSHIIRNAPPNLRLLLATRNENDILRRLGDDLVSKIARTIAAEDSVDEVARFIHSRLKDGTMSFFGNNPDWLHWPSIDQIQRLSIKANGLFIYASAVVDFILFRVRKHGLVKRDRWIEEVEKVGRGSEGVDDLYMFILNAHLEDNEDDDLTAELTLARIKGVLGLIQVAEHPLPLDDLISLLGYEDFDVRHFVERARSVLVPGSEVITGSTIPQFHRTFFDFITQDRAGDFRIDVADSHRHITDRCFALMEAHLHFNMCNLRSSFSSNRRATDPPSQERIPKGLIYASMCWIYHLGKSESGLSPSDLSSIQTFLHKNFLFWLEIVSLAKKAREAIILTNQLADLLALSDCSPKSGEFDLLSFARDVPQCLETFKDCIECSIPHIYISLLAFSLEDSVIAAHYRRKADIMVIPPPPSFRNFAGQDPSLAIYSDSLLAYVRYWRRGTAHDNSLGSISVYDTVEEESSHEPYWEYTGSMSKERHGPAREVVITRFKNPTFGVLKHQSRSSLNWKSITHSCESATGGWVLNLQQDYLFWAPEPYLSTIERALEYPGREVMIEPDLTNLVTGEEWLQCFAVS